MLAYGVGVIGLSVADWSGLSPDEFEAVCRSFVEAEDQRTRDEWERMRLLATITIQPHVKSRLKPDKLLPLPWDNSKKPKAEPVGKEEARRRFVAMVSNK
ncbi:MAG: hypothetical protein IJV11_06990 [Muribaculaceae bacterium]|nr:hypothetical protein [Muribaculaceae bacterium]